MLTACWGKSTKQAPYKQAQQKPNSKAGQLGDHRADFWNLRTTCKLKLTHLTKGGADQAAVVDRQKKKKMLPTSQQPGETTTERLLKYRHQDWMLEE
jgi:hypothetical protein